MLRQAHGGLEEGIMAGAAEVSVDRLRAMMNGFRTTQVIYVLAKLGLADHIADSALTAAELAEIVHADSQSLGRILRLAAFFKLVTEESGGFRLAPAANLLRSRVEGSLRPVAIQFGELHYAAWGALLHSAMTGESAFEHLYGEPLFGYLAAHPDAQVTFDAYMSANKEPFASSLVERYDFAAFRVIVDVGAGNGSVSAAILKANSSLEAIIYDQAQVISAAQEFLEAAGVLNRCRLVSGDFFEAIPRDGDLYLLSHIIHDWEDERALHILRNCRAVMGRSARLILLETVVPPHGQPDEALLMDVNMMVMLTGKERTRDEYDALLRGADLHLSQVIPISGRRSLIEARPQ